MDCLKNNLQQIQTQREAQVVFFKDKYHEFKVSISLPTSAPPHLVIIIVPLE